MRNAIILSLAGLMLLYTNCSEVTFTSDGEREQSVVGFDDETVVEENIETAIATCDQARASGTLMQRSQLVTFSDTREESGRYQVCQFKPGRESDNTPDASGNMTQVNDLLRARYEQRVELDLPANAVVCDADFKARRQEFYYDDIFYFTFNNKILATSLERSLANTARKSYTVNSRQFRIFDYDWSAHVNTDFEHLFSSGPDDYCLGEQEGFGSCQWPESQSSGFIELEFKPEVLVPISFEHDPGVKQSLGFVVTGDNDANIDCYHEELELDVNVKYFIK